jgi:hypothetical protein
VAEPIQSESPDAAILPRNDPRDLFIHLFAIVVLGFGVVELLMMSYSFAAMALPDPADDHDANLLDSIQFATAALLIGLPIYLWVTRFITRDLGANPGKRWLWSCRAAPYFALFLSGLLIAGDLIAAFYYLLTGEFNLRFSLKALVTLLVGALVFGRYFYDTRNGGAISHPFSKPISIAGVVVAVAAIVVGVVVGGPPMHSHFVELDRARVSDLKTLSTRIGAYWQSHHCLPESLDTLATPSEAAAKLVHDPATGSAYQYSTEGSDEYYLCASFDTRSDDYQPTRSSGWPKGYVLDGHWEHATANQCFDFKVQPRGKEKTAS